MTIAQLIKVFNEHRGDEFLKFDRIVNKLSQRPDLHAFMLLDSLVPETSDIISDAQHDEIFLEVSLKDLAKVVLVEQVVDLIRCGVRHEGDYGCLAMFS